MWLAEKKNYYWSFNDSICVSVETKTAKQRIIMFFAFDPLQEQHTSYIKTLTPQLLNL